jgi:hypothetical protein
VVWLQKQSQKRRKVKQIEQLQQTLMPNPHIPSRKQTNAQKLKQNEFFASHARVPIENAEGSIADAQHNRLCVAFHEQQPQQPSDNLPTCISFIQPSEPFIAAHTAWAASTKT